jgi:hypothetical protein
MATFEQVWLDIVKKLRPGTELAGWSRDKGETHSKFRIVELDSTHVSIKPGAGGQVRRISKNDFRQVFAWWDQYNAGSISRKDMTGLSQNTTYIFSILNWQRSAL